MKRITTGTLGMIAALSFAGTVVAQVPSVISYQGRLQVSGTNFSGTGQFKFAIVSPGTNTSRQATATANRTGQFITSYSVVDAGAGYQVPPAVTIVGGGGSGATATANVSGGMVTSISANNAGSGYTSTPLVRIDPPPPAFVYGTFWSNDGSSTGGSEPATAISLSVQQGLFNVFLGDTALGNMLPLAPNVFAQEDARLRIWVSTGSGFTPLIPDQRLGSVGYAMKAATAETAASASSVSAANVTGRMSLTQLPIGLVTNNQTGVSFNGSFTGNAAGLSNVPVSSLTVTATNTVVVGWGLNGDGQAKVPAGLSNVIAVGVGAYHSLALKSDGTVVAWGYNFYGQTNVPSGLNNVVAVAAGEGFSLALKNDGSIIGWGQNAFGELNPPPGLNGVVAIAGGRYHVVALRANGTVVSWGNNGDGQTNVPAGLTDVVAIAPGSTHTAVLKRDGTVVVWGNNSFGQTNLPTNLSNVVALAAGNLHNVAARADGSVVAWGYNGSGQTNVPAGLSNVIHVAACNNHSLALKNDGTVVAWGSNFYGETNVPAGLNSVFAIANGAHASHSLAIRRQIQSPVAWLNADNTFNGNVQFGGMIVGKVGINTLPQQVLHLNVPLNYGEGMQIDSANSGHAPAIYLNHNGNQGRNFRIASYGDNFNPGAFIIRDDTAGGDRFSIDATGNASFSGGIRAEVGTGNKFSLGGNGNFEIDAPGILGGRFTILDNGNVGIGINMPTEKLHVAGNILCNSNLSFGSQTRQMINLWSSGYGIGVQANTLYSRSDSGFAWFRAGTHSNTQDDAGTGGTVLMRLDGSGNLRTAGAVNPPSDRHVKQNFASVDASDVLEKIAAMPINTWSYTNDPGTRHIGPVAQDFHAAFGLGTDEKTIATVDADGVALIGIKALNGKLKALESENAELKRRLERLEQLMHDARQP